MSGERKTQGDTPSCTFNRAEAHCGLVTLTTLYFLNGRSMPWRTPPVGTGGPAWGAAAVLAVAENKYTAIVHRDTLLPSPCIRQFIHRVLRLMGFRIF